MTVSTSTWRQRASSAVIRVARRFLANTPVQRVPMVTTIYRKVSQFGYGREDVTTSFRGVQLTVPTRDATIVPGLVGGFYERLELDVFELLAGMSQTTIDVGANVGLYSCLAARWAPAGGVIAFEPVAENISYLRRNLEQNRVAARVVIEEAAVGETGGELQLYLVADSIGTHSASSRNALGSTNAVSVPMVSLDHYAAEHLDTIDILKVDVEGYEVAVLRGAARILHDRKPTLFIEFMPNHLANCGFSAAEFLDITFGAYEHVFVLDEPQVTLKQCTKQDLLDAGGAHKNINLIATARAEHLEIIQNATHSETETTSFRRRRPDEGSRPNRGVSAPA